MTNKWQFYHTSNDAWQAMYQDCALAKKSIWFEQYIIQNNEIGKKFIELFIKKAKEGVKVYILCDWIGSFSLYRSPLVKELRNNKGEIYFYNPIAKWEIFKISSWFRRNHRKTLLIDTEITYVGSICFDQRMHSWRDSVIRLNIPAIAFTIENYFRFILNRIHRNKIKLPFIENTAPTEGFECLINTIRYTEKDIYLALLREIKNAKKYIYLLTPYFIPAKKIFNALKEATKRGVKVKLIVPESSDVLLVDYAAIYYYIRAIKSNILIYKYQPKVLHAKYAIIDDNWATIGSLNLDYLSIMRNNELNITITNQQAIAELKNQYELDLTHTRAITLQELHNRPFWQKIIGFIGLTFKQFL